MSMFPYYVNCCPERLLDQHFGMGVFPEDYEDMLTSLAHAPRPSSYYYRPWRSWNRSTSRQDFGSKVFTHKDGFQVSLDVQQFTPEEISVKTVGNEIIIEGKHEEKQDDHGYISRQFVRKYRIPDNHIPEEAMSSVSSDGVLCVTVPHRQKNELQDERVVSITATGQPHNQITNNK